MIPTTRMIPRLPCPVLSAAAALGAVLATCPAGAQTKVPTVNCYDEVARPRPIYVAGSTAIRPFLGYASQLLAAEEDPYTIIYQSQGSCTGVDAIYSSDMGDQLIEDIPETPERSANYAIFFGADGETTQECFLTPGGDLVDIGISDVFASTCGYEGPPAGAEIRDFEGPIQPFVFTVPAASSQRTISYEAAYMVFGLGGYGGVAAPWTDPAFYYIRNAKSGTQQLFGTAIGVPAAGWWGVDRGSNTNVQNQLKLLLSSTDAEKAIGLLGTDFADSERANLRALAYQARGQSCAYWPDSTPFARDKTNVRDGHYDIWGPVHFYTRVGSGGTPSDAASALVTRFAAPKLDQGLIQIITEKSLVPKCAMYVQRTEEVGPLQRYTTDSPCHCFFEQVANGKTECQTCTLPGECPKDRPICSYGYCEAPQQ